MGFRGPLADSYWAAVALVLMALTPFLVLSSAVFPLQEVLAKGTGLTEGGLELTNGMADAAYCFGTVAAVQMLQRLPARRLLLLFATLFVIGSMLAAWAPLGGLFTAGRVLQGLTTSLMLIAAVPPLVTGWPKQRMRPTAVTMNLAIFGAVALGPVVGGVFAGQESWRPLFWIVAGLGAAALAFVVLTFEDAPPQNEDAPIDVVSVLLAGGGCAAAFFGVSQLSDHRMLDLVVLAPLLAGMALLVALLAHQYTVSDPLMPVRKLARTIPVAAIVVAMAAGAASVALVELAESGLELRMVPPSHAAMLFWPEFGGAVLTALLFGAIFFTRYTPVLAFSGLLVLGGAAAVLTGVATGGDALVLVGSGGVGLGVGASVSPALFVTGFSLPSRLLPRAFALVELLRGVAAFLTAPLLLHLAETAGPSPAAGIETATWVAMGIALGGAALAAAIFTLGRAKLQRPDVETWLEGEEPAIESPAPGRGAAAASRDRRAAEPPAPAGERARSSPTDGERPPAR
jgi:MFS family permease